MKKADVEKVPKHESVGKTDLPLPFFFSLQPEHTIQYLKLNTWQSRTHDQTFLKTEHRTLIFPTSNSPPNLSTGRANSKISPKTDTPQTCFKRRTSRISLRPATEFQNSLSGWTHGQKTVSDLTDDQDWSLGQTHDQNLYRVGQTTKNRTCDHKKY